MGDRIFPSVFIITYYCYFDSQVLSFDEPLLTPECNIVESYLSQKYGIPLAGSATALGGSGAGVSGSIGQRRPDGEERQAHIGLPASRREGAAGAAAALSVLPSAPSRPLANSQDSSSRTSQAIPRKEADSSTDSKAAVPVKRAEEAPSGGSNKPPKPSAVDGDGFAVDRPPREGEKLSAGLLTNACTGSKDPFAGIIISLRMNAYCTAPETRLVCTACMYTVDQSIETFKPPQGSGFSDIMKWEDARKETLDNIKRMTVGGNQLRSTIHKEVRRLQLLRFEIFCKYAEK